VSQYGIAFGFFSELEKIAAPGQQQQAMPTSPLQIENQALTEELQNIQLKLQLRKEPESDAVLGHGKSPLKKPPRLRHENSVADFSNRTVRTFPFLSVTSDG
jgi:hypothetical protein